LQEAGADRQEVIGVMKGNVLFAKKRLKNARVKTVA
jgi:hypothetical protein